MAAKRMTVLCVGLLGLAVVTVTQQALAQEKILTVGQITAAGGLDPFLALSQDATNSIASAYDTVLKEGQRIDQNGLLVPDYDVSHIRPWLAESWTMSDDNKTITLKLRKGVISHAGNELTAADLQYTWDRAWAVGGEGGFQVKSALRISEPSWKVVDKYTWSVTLPFANHFLVDEFWEQKFGIVWDSTEAKKHATPNDPWSNEWLYTHEAGFGPYKVDSYNPGNSVVLVRHDQYWGQRPYFDKIIIQEVPSAATRLAAVVSGALDVATDIPPRDLVKFKDNPNIHIWSDPGNAVTRLAFDVSRPPLNDIRLRQALNFATPVDKIRQAVYFDYGVPLKSSIPATHPYSTPQFWNYNYDPDKARSLIAEVGLKPDYVLDINYDGNVETHKQLATLLGSAFQEVGLKVNLVAQPSATYFSLMSKPGSYSSWLFQNNPIIPDAGYFYSWAYTCGGSYNPFRYCDKEFDKEVYAGIESYNQQEIKAHYTKAQEIQTEAATEVWLAHPGWQLVTRSNIEGVGFEPAYGPYFFQWHRK